MGMKIQFLLTQDLKRPAGSGRYFPIAKALSKLGHSVVISALHSDFAKVKNRHFEHGGVEVEYVGQMHVKKQGDRKAYFSGFRLILIALTGTIALIIAGMRARADVIHVCKGHPMNGIAAWVIHKLRGTPIFLDSDDYEALNNRFSSRWQQQIVAWFENWIPKYVVGITVSSSYLFERHKSLGVDPKSIYLVPNGFDKDRFDVLDHPNARTIISKLRMELNIPSDFKVVAYIGSMRLLNHSIDLALEAFVHLLAEMPNVCFVMVGGGEDLDKLYQQAQDLGLSDRVKFTGHVSASEIPYYFRVADVTIDPKRDAEIDKSCLALKLVESIAACVPCISADVGDSKELVGDAGMAVKPGDSKALSDGIKVVLSNDVLAGNMRDAAQKLRQHYSWDTRIFEFIRVYDY